jgi:hypothetical protein
VAILDYVQDRPFVWIDDEITEADREYVARYHSGPSKLHLVSPRTGLLDADFIEIASWLEGLKQ